MADINKLLREFGNVWELDGDLMRCRRCNRAQIATRAEEKFEHATTCNRRHGHPWIALQAMLLSMALPGAKP